MIVVGREIITAALVRRWGPATGWLLRADGMTSADFGAMGLALSTFRARDWILDSGRKRGRLKVYGAGSGTDHHPPPDQAWPEIADALLTKDASAP